MRKLVVTLFGLSLMAGANAFVWIEQDDAPAFVGGNTAQAVCGDGQLTEIRGTFLAPPGVYGVDSYFIRIVRPVLFNATTVGGTNIDTQLFLFRMNGMGVLHNDDDHSGNYVQSTIGANGGDVYINGDPVGWNEFAQRLDPGCYVITISRYDRDPLDANGEELWEDEPFDQQRVPDGPGRNNPVASWGGTGDTNTVNYSIFFEGVEGCCVPEPASLLAVGAGLAALAARRRRK